MLKEYIPCHQNQQDHPLTVETTNSLNEPEIERLGREKDQGSSIGPQAEIHLNTKWLRQGVH